MVEARAVEIEWVDCESSNIAQYGYHTACQILAVRFSFGSVYYYFGVPEELFMGLEGAESKGKFLNAEIKGSYEYTKIS